MLETEAVVLRKEITHYRVWIGLESNLAFDRPSMRRLLDMNIHPESVEIVVREIEGDERNEPEDLEILLRHENLGHLWVQPNLKDP